MEFVQETTDQKETIAAIATPAGEGAIAAIRISGAEAFEIAAKIYSRARLLGRSFFVSHQASFGQILNSSGEGVDSVILLPFQAPKSYTGEDSVEIYCHGGSLITKSVLAEVLRAGARQARPGEFTFRALMNGKIDLAQAEAVQALIGAKNEKMVRAATQLLEGRLSEKVRSFQMRLTDIAATLEAFLDFPEEGLEVESLKKLEQDIQEISSEIGRLIKTYQEGRLIHQGMRVALIGAPNAGKSSLMNLLLQKSRSIVSDQPGTTRDTVEEGIRLFGVHLLLVDTAGIRETLDGIEEEGVRRSWKAVHEADLILHLVDSSRPELFLEKLPMEKTLLIWNKLDLVHEEPFKKGVPYQVALSCLKKEGLERLLACLEKMIFSHGLASQEELILTEARHKQALDESLLALEKVKLGIESSLSLEYITLEVREALYHLGKIIGTNISEEILTTLFNKFCIGK